MKGSPVAERRELAKKAAGSAAGFPRRTPASAVSALSCCPTALAAAPLNPQECHHLLRMEKRAFGVMERRGFWIPCCFLFPPPRKWGAREPSRRRLLAQLKTVQGVRIRICRPTDLYSQIQTNISFLGFAQSFEWR